MKKIYIYEGALTNSSGWISAQNEKQRISDLQNKFNSDEKIIIRHNLTTAPQEFAINENIDKLLNSNGLDILPITLVDDKVVLTGRYPTDSEISNYLGIN